MCGLVSADAVKFNVFVELFKRNDIWRLVCKSIGVS